MHEKRAKSKYCPPCGLHLCDIVQKLSVHNLTQINFFTIDYDIDKMIKCFQTKMRKRYRIPPSLVEKYKKDIFFMVEIDFTCMAQE